MGLTLAKKISISLVGVIVLAVFSSAAALLSSWQMGALIEQALNENLSAVRAAEELEIAVLEQRGFVASYILDGGNREWLLELSQRERNFHDWLGRARETAHTAEEREILRKLEQVYRQYDAKRDEVVALFDRGEVTEAEKLLVNDVGDLYREAYVLCESFIEANQRNVDDSVADARRQIRRVSWAVGGCVLLTVGLGIALLWLFFYGVVFPVRAMVADARGFVGETPPESQPLPTDELRAVGVYLRNLMTDVADTRTTLERSRNQLKDAEKLASVGKLAASVAHEIRNPLTAIKMWLFSIQKQVGADGELARKFEIVSEEIGRLENIVRNFLEFSRPVELKLSVESISSMLDKAVELIEPRIGDRNITLSRKDAQNLPPVSADRDQLKQVFLNLINNAVEAIGEEGQIRVITTAESDAEGRPMVIVRVSDNGPGIPEEVFERIFEPFFTTKDEGTGLGLCVAAQIMARHEGRLVLESSSRDGTTFAVYIPATSTQKT
jgi:signal transduction histidine kinase